MDVAGPREAAKGCSAFSLGGLEEGDCPETGADVRVLHMLRVDSVEWWEGYLGGV
jgi:hypothetical protein